MSESLPLPSAMQPFVPTTTRNIERANHLLAVRQHPGFIDIMHLLQEMVQTAVDQCSDYPGWDAQQIVVLKVRQQTAKEMYQLLIAKIQEAIRTGVEESQRLESEKAIPPKTVQEILEQGDHVRRLTLEKFAEMDTANESRAPGSF